MPGNFATNAAWIGSYRSGLPTPYRTSLPSCFASGYSVAYACSSWLVLAPLVGAATAAAAVDARAAGGAVGSAPPGGAAVGEAASGGLHAATPSAISAPTNPN